jgi:hypothetical protein
MRAEGRIRGMGRRELLLAAILLHRLFHDSLPRAAGRLG